MELPFDKLSKLAKRIAWEVVGEGMPLGTWLQVAQTKEGEEAIRLVVLFPDSRAAEVKGEQLITIMGRIKEDLRDAGETRLPLVSFARMEDQPELEGAHPGASS